VAYQYGSEFEQRIGCLEASVSSIQGPSNTYYCVLNRISHHDPYSCPRTHTLRLQTASKGIAFGVQGSVSQSVVLVLGDDAAINR
jgi:hypothetical protein